MPHKVASPFFIFPGQMVSSATTPFLSLCMKVPLGTLLSHEVLF
jgi:hypothetical protein